MLPGTWYAKDDSIHVVNPDGTETIYPTNWAETRRLRQLEEKLKQEQSRAEVRENQQEKRDAASKKRGGRGC